MIPLIRSTFYKETETKERLIGFIQKAKILSFGAQCEAFEKKFARWQERKYCVFLNSGSSANLAIIQTLLNLGKLQKEDLVGFSAVTWSTNVMPILQLGLRAIPIDVHLSTLNVSSQNVKQVLRKYPLKALFLTNLLGFCDDIDKIRDLCNQQNILLIEDNCESLGSEYKGKKLGNFGLASTNSFYVGHHMSTIEGGAVCTDDEEIATMLKIVRAHGWDRNLDFAKQHQMRKKFNIHSEFYSRYTFYDLGYNFRPTEINGFIGNLQLRFVDEIIRKRQDNFLELAKILYTQKDLYYPVQFSHMTTISNFAVPLLCKTSAIKEALVKKSKNIVEIRPVLGGDITEQPFFLKYTKEFSRFYCPNATIIHDQGFYFGNNPELTRSELKKILSIFTSL